MTPQQAFNVVATACGKLTSLTMNDGVVLNQALMVLKGLVESQGAQKTPEEEKKEG